MARKDDPMWSYQFRNPRWLVSQISLSRRVGAYKSAAVFARQGMKVARQQKLKQLLMFFEDQYRVNRQRRSSGS